MKVVGNLAAETVDQLSATVVNRFGLIAIKIDRADLFFQLLRRCTRVVSGAAVSFKQFDRDFVDEVVARLRREDQCNQQLQRIAEVEVELGVAVDPFEASDDLFEPHLLVAGIGASLTDGVRFSFHEKYVSKKSIRGGKNQMEENALSTAKQNIRQLKKQKTEILASTPDRKKLKRIQRKIKLLKRASRELAQKKKAAAAKAQADAAAKEAAEKAAAAAAKAAEATAG